MKIKYILGFFVMAFIFTSCEAPLDDIYSSLDSLQTSDDEYMQNYIGKALAESTYTLTEDDYKLSSNDDVATYLNFSSSVPAEEHLAEILDQLFYASVASEMSVNYNYYAGLPDYLPVGAVESYELVDADYDAMGDPGPGHYNNFSSSYPPEDFLPDMMLDKYPSAVSGDGYFVTYDYYSSGVSTLSDYYEFDGTVWAATAIPNSYILTNEDYESMGDPGPGHYHNFSSGTEPDTYLATFLGIRFPYAVVGDSKIPVYKYYAGGGVTETRMDEYKFDGSVWTKTISVLEQTGLFSYDGANWGFVPPIKFIETTKAFTIEYTLTDADYELVGNGKYHNFDVRAGKAEETIEVRIEKLTIVLKANFEVAVGDVYSVTYDVYDGTNTTMTTVLEAVEDVK